MKGVEKGKQVAKETIMKKELKGVWAKNWRNPTSFECVSGPLCLPS